MSAWDLPTSAVINGSEYAIRSDYRAVLDVLTILCDAELSDNERGALALEIFYPNYHEINPRDYKEAVEFLTYFINGGTSQPKKPSRKLADWNKDFPLIVNPVNRVLGFEVRSVDYLHWWTFLSAYYEIGDCLFAQVVSIRNKKAKHKKLEKYESEFYKEHRDLIDFNVEETEEEKTILDEWI